jgi:glycosyltransferase involved in cell wall biosynthesis
MRVVIVMRSQSGVPGGAGVPGGQIGMIQLARALAELGVHVELFVGGHRMGYLQGLEGVATTYFRWPAGLDRLFGAAPARLRTFGRDLRRRRWLDAVASLPGIATADVVHVQGLVDAESVLGRFSGPLVVTHWGRVGRWRPSGSVAHDQLLQRRLARLRESIKLVAIGEAQAGELAAVGLPAVEVIPPGIDLRHFIPGDRVEARRRAGLPAGDGIVLYVGRLAADKNVETLLRAIALPSRHSRRTRLIIVGDGARREQLQQLSTDLGIGVATTFLPFVPHNDLPAYYQGCDVTVVPSDRLETFCMVGLEAIACGCPLVVSDQVPEIVRRFPAVPAVAPFDAEDLRRRIDDALDDRVAPVADPAIADYDWGAVARRYIALYQMALRHAA